MWLSLLEVQWSSIVSVKLLKESGFSIINRLLLMNDCPKGLNCLTGKMMTCSSKWKLSEWKDFNLPDGYRNHSYLLSYYLYHSLPLKPSYDSLFVLLVRMFFISVHDLEIRVQKWMAPNRKAQFYHMARSSAVPAFSVGPQLTTRDVAMLFLERDKQQEGWQ